MEVKTVLTGTGGAAAGITLSDFISEFISRATGLAGWAKVGAKGLFKTFFGCIFYAISTRLLGLPSLFCEIFAYSTWGSIALDVCEQLYAGGIPGLAETAALAVRARIRGVEAVKKELGIAESKEKVPGKVTVTDRYD